MSQGLFSYPAKAAFNRILPKNKIYEHAKPSNRVRDLFVSQIQQITWQYKLSPETINLPSRPGVPEIQIFSITVKINDPSEDVLRCIDEAIPFPIFYQIIFGNKIKVITAYKRPSDADSTKWVIDAYFETSWQSIDSERSGLPVALDLAGLYTQMLRQCIPIPARNGEALKDHVARIVQIQSKEKECKKIKARLQKEKQFNRKVELNAQIRALKNELDSLSA